MDWSEPVAGVHPLIWLLLVLIFGPTGLLSVLAANRFGVLGALSRWWNERTKRAIRREHDEQQERRRGSDLAYAALESDVKRLAAQVDAQARRHEKEMQRLRNHMQKDREWYDGVVAELRLALTRWQGWGEWVTQWALLAEHPSEPFIPFAQYVSEQADPGGSDAPGG